MDVKLATLIKSLNIMDVIFSGFTVDTVTHSSCQIATKNNDAHTCTCLLAHCKMYTNH